MLARRIEEPEQFWYFREAGDLPQNTAARWAGPVIPSGTVIHRVMITSGIEPGGKPEGLHVLVFLTAWEKINVGLAIREEQIIWFHERQLDIGWYPMCDDCHEEFTMHKIVRGSNLRFGIIITNVTNKILSCRVGILHSTP